MKKHFSHKLTNEKKSVEVYHSSVLNVTVCEFWRRSIQALQSTDHLVSFLQTSLGQNRRGTWQSPYTELHWAQNEMHYHGAAWKTFLQWVFKDHSNSHRCLQGPETALLFPLTLYDSVCLVILYMVILFVFVLAKCLQLDQCHLLVLRDNSSSN